MTKDFKEIPATKQSIAQRKLVYGIGVNDAKYMVRPNLNGKQVMCMFYLKWCNMLKRCYEPKYHERNPAYIGCTVCNSWLTFSNFKAWMSKQNWKGKELDKDLLFPGSKEYSPETCLFVPKEINLLLNDRAASRGEWPIGVAFNRASGRFTAQCGVNGRLKHLGNFKAADEAHKAYVRFKEDHVHRIALDQEEPLRSALLNWRVSV